MLLLIFLALTVSVHSQVAKPPRKVGFQYVRGHSSAKVHLEVFLDLVCPDSKETWPHLKDVANHYGAGNVDLIVHLFPLPFHQNAFYASRAAYVIHYITNGNRTFDWIDKILLEKLTFLTDRSFYNKSDADLLNLFVTWVTEMGNINETAFLNLVDRRTSNEFEKYTRFMWKMACSRGVAGTPTFFVNGINYPNILATWGLTEWGQLLDPLLAPQLFDGIDDIEEDSSCPVTSETCADNGSSSTTPMTTLRILFYVVAALSIHLRRHLNV